MKRALIIFLVTLLSTSVVYAQSDSDEIIEIVVSQKMPGPPLWQVKNGDNTLWIYGSLDLVPKKLAWDSNRVERVIAQSDAYLEPPSMYANDLVGPIKMIKLYRQYKKMTKNKDKKKLDEILDAELYTRLETLKAEYGPKGKGLYKLRPLFAAGKIAEEALKETDLVSSGFIVNKIGKLIKRQKLPKIKSEYEFERSSYTSLIEEISQIPLALEIACLETVLEGLEVDLEAKRERALAWSKGYMDEIYAMDFPDTQANCESAMLSGSQIAEAMAVTEEQWLENAKNVLENNENTFAILSMFELLNEDGLLEKLRLAGYEIKRPG